MINCITTTLDPYNPTTSNPWNEVTIRHLYSRMGFGANFQNIESAKSMNPVDLVDNIIYEATQAPLLEVPFWAEWKFSDFEKGSEFTQSFEFILERIRIFLNNGLDKPFREKMVLFWSNHFVTKLSSYESAIFFNEYLEVLQRNALGNFKTFTKEIGLTRAMLFFLGGVKNYKNSPNENYARELYELFTLGLDNGYTEQDIRETARAFTGHVRYLNDWGDITFNAAHFDNNEKTIFGVTSNFNYETSIDLLFEKKSELIAKYVCEKIYITFVNPDPSPEIVNQLATIFLNNNWEIAPVLQALFTSEHFFDQKAHNSIFKSHLELFLQLLHTLESPITTDRISEFYYFIHTLGQALFDPTDVSGWKGDKAWLNSGSLSSRWLYLEWFHYNVFFQQDSKYILPWLKKTANNSNDVNEVVRKVVDSFLVNGLSTDTDYDKFIAVFKGQIPENYFTDGLWNLNWDGVEWQYYNLFKELRKAPDIHIW